MNHPEQVQELIRAIESGQESIEVRNTADIDHLLDSSWYPIGRALAKVCVPIDRFLWRTIYLRLTRLGRKLLGPKLWQTLRSKFNFI